jgi:hypothetical protein
MSTYTVDWWCKKCGGAIQATHNSIDKKKFPYICAACGQGYVNHGGLIPVYLYGGTNPNLFGRYPPMPVGGWSVMDGEN